MSLQGAEGPVDICDIRELLRKLREHHMCMFAVTWLTGGIANLKTAFVSLLALLQVIEACVHALCSSDNWF